MGKHCTQNQIKNQPKYKNFSSTPVHARAYGSETLTRKKRVAESVGVAQLDERSGLPQMV